MWTDSMAYNMLHLFIAKLAKKTYLGDFSKFLFCMAD